MENFCPEQQTFYELKRLGVGDFDPQLVLIAR
jgi:hypothetical protein